jgi:alpha-beta hydrolase superfamily lysophospholipase
MRRLSARIFLVVCLLVIGAAAIWGPAYARSASLVIRAAQLQGFLLNAAKVQAQRYTVEPVATIHTRHGDVRSRLYRPDTIRRAVLLVPGIHAMGIDEPRLTGLSNELAATGLAVVTMELPDLASYRFTPETVDLIEDGSRWLTARRDLTPDGTIGLMGISFAGGLAVVAAGRPAIRDHLAFVFSFGGHGDLPRVLRYLCTGLEPPRPDDSPGTAPHVRPPHDYGVAVILVSLADRLVPPDQVEPLRHGVVTFLTASQLDLIDKAKASAVFDQARAIAQQLPEPAASLMQQVNARDVKGLGARLLPVLQTIQYPDSVSPDHSPPPRAPVYLLHGTDDTVIPSVASLLLAKHLEGKTRVHTLLSGLITHAEVDRAAAAADVIKLVGFWAELLNE